jgi:hypothetical protein
MRIIGFALLFGAAAGLVALGLGGRLAMAALVLAGGGRPEITLGGTLEVLAVGTGYGAAGGLLALGMHRAFGTRVRPWHSGALGLSLLLLAWLTSRAGRGAAAGLTAPPLLGVALAVGCFVGYGFLVQVLLSRWLDHRGSDPGKAAA